MKLLATVTLAGPFGSTLTVVVTELPGTDAWIVTVCATLIVAAEIWKLAVSCPAGTMTTEGTETAELLDVSFIAVSV